jgi:hypothetical protein
MISMYINYDFQNFGKALSKKMSCMCDKEVLFFVAESCDTSQSLYLLLIVHIHDLHVRLKTWRFFLLDKERID